jgi:hypothetical protein
VSEEADYQKAAIRWLEAKLPSLRCPLCSHEHFLVAELVASPGVTNVTLNLAAATPFVPVVCTNCAHTLLFSAVVMGVVPRESS